MAKGMIRGPLKNRLRRSWETVMTTFQFERELRLTFHWPRVHRVTLRKVNRHFRQTISVLELVHTCRAKPMGPTWGLVTEPSLFFFFFFFLAHWAEGSQDELIGWDSSRRPCVRPHFQPWISLRPAGRSRSNFIWSIIWVGERLH